MMLQRSRGSLAGLVRRFWSPVFFAYAIAGGVAVASFLSTLVLARLSGPAVIGEYALAMSTAGLLTSFVMLGLDRILIREVAGDLRQGRDARARTTLAVITRIVGGGTVIVAAIYAAVILWTPFAAMIGGTSRVLVLVAGGAIAWAALRVGYSGLRAAGSPVIGQLFEAMPTYLFLLGIGSCLLIRVAPDATTAVAIAIGAQALAALGAWILLGPRVRRWPAGARLPRGQRRALLAAGIPLMGSLFLQVFSDWFVLARIGAVAGAADTGAFRVAVQIITIIAMLVSTTESYVAAFIAGDFRAGRPDLAWRRHRRATLLMLVLTAPAFAILFAVPRPLLELAFGPGFAVAATALVIMTGGQLFNVLSGPLGMMLVMSGRHQALFMLTLGGLALLVVLAWWLVPIYGLAGAAIAQASAVVFRTTIGYGYARLRIPARAEPR